MVIRLSDHVTYGTIFRFAFPSVCMIIFTSIYGVVDGFFISNFIGKTAFAAVNFVLPVLLILGAIGYMFGTGGTAVVAHAMGKGEKDDANRLFSLFIAVSVLIALVLAVIGAIAMRRIAVLLGAEETMLEDCVTYGRIVVLALPALVLQAEFQSFFVTAEKPKLGLAVTIMAGLTNLALDILLVWVFPFGVAGAALATAISQLAGGVIPLLYFSRDNSSALRLVRPLWSLGALFKACTNGSSEFMSNVTMSVAGMVYNIQLLRYAGENGVAAYGAMLYVAWIFSSAFMGYGIGIAPVIAYHDGANNRSEVRSLFCKSLCIIGVVSLSMAAVSQVFAKPLCGIFLGYDAALLDLACEGFRLYSLCFLFMGIAIFGSAFFTALNDGLVSALIAFLRTLVFEIITVLVLPMFWGIRGIWLSPVFAELLAATLTVLFFLLIKKWKM